jgi:hypothetical protein
VGLHRPSLGFAQRARLEQDLIGNADLADIVEQETDLGARVLRELGIDAARELERIVLNPLRVRAGGDVLRFERGRERADGLAVGALEQPALGALELEQVPEVVRVEDQLAASMRFGAGRSPSVTRSTVASSSSGLNGFRT